MLFNLRKKEAWFECIEMLWARGVLIRYSHQWESITATNIPPDEWTQGSLLAFSCPYSWPATCRTAGFADKPSSVPRESIGVSPSTSIICQAAPSSSPPELVHLLTIHRQAIWSSFFWRPANMWYLIWCGALWALQEPDKRLSKTLAGHYFNYSQVQCKVVPAKATAHLAVLQCCSGRRKF